MNSEKITGLPTNWMKNTLKGLVVGAIIGLVMNLVLTIFGRTKFFEMLLFLISITSLTLGSGASIGTILKETKNKGCLKALALIFGLGTIHGFVLGLGMSFVFEKQFLIWLGPLVGFVISLPITTVCMGGLYPNDSLQDTFGG